VKLQVDRNLEAGRSGKAVFAACNATLFTTKLTFFDASRSFWNNSAAIRGARTSRNPASNPQKTDSVLFRHVIFGKSVEIGELIFAVTFSALTAAYLRFYLLHRTSCSYEWYSPATAHQPTIKALGFRQWRIRSM
jgi:hypothetical protein